MPNMLPAEVISQPPPAALCEPQSLLQPCFLAMLVARAQEAGLNSLHMCSSWLCQLLHLHHACMPRPTLPYDSS